MTFSRRSFMSMVAAAAATAVAPRLAFGSRNGSMQAARPGPHPWLEIDAGALAHNVRAVSRLSGGRPVIAVVKNNSYGLGLSAAAPILESQPEVALLAVVRAEEALQLRSAGVRKPVLLMGPATEDELVELVRLDVLQSPYRDDAPAILSRVAQRAGRPVRAHAYIDTGMHRMGMPIARALPWLERLGATGQIRVEGAFTELTEDADFDKGQATRLKELGATARIAFLHAASSDAVMHGSSDTFLDAVRPGLSLYGGYVSQAAMARGDLRVAYRLKSRVIRVDRLEAGEGVSYHRRFVADRPLWTATLAIGHVDGYPSGAVKGCEVLARGRLFPVIGTVSASHTIIAVGEERVVEVGDEVTLVGPEHPALHPNEVARRAGWSEYNMFMHLAQGLERVVV